VTRTHRFIEVSFLPKTNALTVAERDDLLEFEFCPGQARVRAPIGNRTAGNADGGR